MPKNWLVSALGIASAGVIAAAGCASAATKATAADNIPLAAASTARGAVHFVGYSLNSDGPRFSVILTGAVGDYGPAVAVYPNGKIDPDHTSELKLELRHGSFRLNIAKLDKEVAAAASRWRTAPTCSYYLNVTAPTPVVRGSGAGSYAGISGKFDTTVSIDEVDVRPCPNATSKFIAQLIVFEGSGIVSLR